jgi:hypothetical protein
MAAQDTSLLSQILSTQKALLSVFSSEKKKDKEDDKEKAKVETQKGTGGFNEMLGELKTLNDTNKKQLETLQKIEKKLVGGAGTSGDSIKLSQGFGEKVSSVGMGMVDLAKGLVMLVGGLTFTILLVPLAPLLLISAKIIEYAVKFYASIYDQLGDKKIQKNIDTGNETLKMMQIGILSFMKTLALTALLAPIAPLIAIGVGVVYLSLKAYTTIFTSIGDKETKKKIDAGSDVIQQMSKSLAIFSLGIISTALVFMATGLEEIGKVALIMLGFAGIFMLIGKADKTIEKGAKAASWMGLGMASIGLGVAALSLGLAFAGSVLAGGAGSAILGGLAALGVLAVAGVTFAIIGLASPLIRSGALAVAAIGLGLAVFGLGLTVYLTGIAKVMGVGGAGIAGGTQVSGGFFDTVGSMLVGMGVIAVGALALVLYGTIFALAGQAEFGVPMAIGLGALAMAGAGLSLVFFGFGLNYYLGVIAKNSGVSGEGSGMTVSADSFKAGFTTNASALGMLLGVGAIFALAGAVSPLIGLGAAAIAGAGLALVSLGYGIKKFNELVPPGTKVGDDLKTNLVSIREAMLAFVDGETSEGGVWGAIKGLGKSVLTGGKLAVALGNAMLIGPALTSIAQGIGAWANIQNIPSIIGYDKLGQPIYDKNKTANVDLALKNLKTYLPGIVQPFIDLSNMASLSNTSVLSTFTGVDLGSSPFYRGVTASAQMGSALTSIAQGVSQWANLTSVGKFVGYDENNQPMFEPTAKGGNVDLALKNISTYLPQIIQPFIDLSNTANLGNTSLLSVVTGADLGDSPFYRGVNAAAGIGTVLSSVAKGISEWANLTNADEFIGYDEKGQPKFKKGSKGGNVMLALQNITNVLSTTGSMSILKPFMDLANSAGLKTGTSLFSLIAGDDMGETPFAMGIAASSQIGAVLSSLGQGISTFSTLSAVPEIIGVDKKTGKPIYSGKTVDVTTSVTNLQTILTKMVDVISSLDEEKILKIKNISTNLAPFTDFISKFLSAKPAEFAKQLTGVNNSIKGMAVTNAADPKKRMFLSIFTEEMTKLSKIADPFTKFVNSFANMANSLKVFAENFKLMNPDGINAFKLWTDSISTLSTANPETFASNVETANKAINTAYQSSDGNSMTADVVDYVKGVFGGGDKQAAIKDANKPAPKAVTAPVQAPIKIDYQALGQAVAAALGNQQLNVYVVGEDPNVGRKKR